MKIAKYLFGIVFLITSLWGQFANPGFEGDEPNYYSKAGTSATAELTWAVDEYRTGTRSLKIVKSSADGTAVWESEDLYRYWSPGAGADVAIEFGGWVKLDGINTSPTTDDEKVQLSFQFVDASGNDMLGAPLVLDVPQDQSSTGWVEVKSSTPVSFPVGISRITADFVFGANATGTAWLDDYFMRNPADYGTWVGDLFNAEVDVPDGWYYWTQGMSKGLSEWNPRTTVFFGQTTDEARSGNASLQMTKTTLEDELVVNSDPVSFVNDGTPLVFSAWVKTDLAEGMAALANSDPTAAMGFTVIWFNGGNGADGWDENSGADYRFRVAGDQSAWTQYSAVLTPPEGATQFSLRARYWAQFVGTTYWDDFHVKRAYPSETFLNPGFEGTEPNYFSAVGPSDELTWATDEYRTGSRSLKISKTTIGHAASWVSEDLYRYWSAGAGADVALEVGAWVKMVSVGQGPTDDAKAQIIYRFLDENDNDLLGAPIVLDLPGTISTTSGWLEIKSATPISLPISPTKVTAEVKMNNFATGTLYVDDFFLRNPADYETWVGDLFNAEVDVPDGWYYWTASMGKGLSEWNPRTTVFFGQTTDEARSGDASLQMTKATTEEELVVNSDPVSFVNDGTPLVFSAWVKTDLAEGMAALANSDPTAAMGFTVIWFNGGNGADGWDENSGADYRFTIAGDQSDWTQYSAVLTPPEGATQFSLRARYWNAFVGTTYWDDFEVYRSSPLATEDEYSTATVPTKFRLIDAYPNPFNPQVNIAFEMPQEGNVKLLIYDITGHLVSTLVNNTLGVGKHQIKWNAVTNNGVQVPTGIYLVRLELDGLETKLTKITYMK